MTNWNTPNIPAIKTEPRGKKYNIYYILLHIYYIYILHYNIYI